MQLENYSDLDGRRVRNDQERDERWPYLSPHDTRRTWVHLTLEAGALPSVLMQWDGWEDYPLSLIHI